MKDCSTHSTESPKKTCMRLADLNGLELETLQALFLLTLLIIIGGQKQGFEDG